MTETSVSTVYPPPTDGWFQLAWSGELRLKQIIRRSVYGTQVVLFRGDDGVARALDAHCPHLGAHLGVGGRVVGACIECPFHAWRFRGDGTCDHIPYAKKIPPRARLRSWHVVERDGMIFVWRDAEGGSPLRPLPTIHGYHRDRYTRWQTREFTMSATSLDVLENSVDSVHFEKTHRNGETRLEMLSEGSVLELKQHTTARVLGVSVKTTLHYQMHEPGFHYLWVTGIAGAEVLVFSSLTPIDEGRVTNRLSIALAIPRSLRWLRPLYEALLVPMTWRMMMTYREDVVIWNAKIFRESPVLCHADEGISILRKWYSRFISRSRDDSERPVLPLPIRTRRVGGA